MSTLETTEKINAVITPEELLKHWEGHRGLTRKLIEAFPEKDLFEYSIGGMRPAAQLVQEMLDLGAAGIKEMLTGEPATFNGHLLEAKTKQDLLAIWDKNTSDLLEYLGKIPAEKFHDQIVSFGLYEGTICANIFYFIDNEIHHRAQAYVYLRSLGVEPPAFWDRY